MPNNNEMPELLPCPFCGERTDDGFLPHKGSCYIMQKAIGASPEVLLDAWNHRAQPPQNVEGEQAIKAEPHPDYEMLKRQFNALKSVANSQALQLSHWGRKDYLLSEARLKELNASLDSEREMNAELTAEVERLSHPKQSEPVGDNAKCKAMYDEAERYAWKDYPDDVERRLAYLAGVSFAYGFLKEGRK